MLAVLSLETELFLKLKKKFIQFLKVTFRLQLVQNIGSIPRVVQYILEPVLHPVVCTSSSLTPMLPLPPIGNH